MLPLTFIDLFCGCGGFSLGLERAGFACLAAVDFNPEAIRVFQRNFANVPHALERDLTRFRPEELAEMLGTDRVDVIVGGPPVPGIQHGPKSGRREQRDTDCGR